MLKHLAEGPAIMSITIPAPDLSDFNEDEDAPESLQEVLIDHAILHIETLQRAFDMDVQDERANIDEVKVDDVDLDGDAVVIHFTYHFSAYYGCRDQNYADSESGIAVGKVVGKTWTFDPYIPPPRLYPNEEL